MTKVEVLICIVLYALSMKIIAGKNKNEKTKEWFLVGNRKIKWFSLSLSTAATWIWAPSLFIAAEVAYKYGIQGAAWFILPNVATLLLFSYYADKMRKIKPEGWTFSYYIKEEYSKRVHNIFLVESFGLQILSFAVQLLAGAVVINKLSGLNYSVSVLLMAIVPLLYSLSNGIISSVKTDVWKMISITGILFITIPVVLFNADNISFSGINKDYVTLFSRNGLNLALTFGIPTTIGLLSGAFGDQMFWQRIFSVNKEDTRKMMNMSAFIFAIVPTLIAMLGFVATGSSLTVNDTQLTNFITVRIFAGKGFVVAFFILILSGLISTLDSILNAVSSVVGHDVIERVNKNSWIYEVHKRNVLFAPRVAMLIVAILGVLIANIPGIKIVHLFLFYGALRSSVMLPTIFSIKKIKMSERGLFIGLITAILAGIPVFGYAQINSIPLLTTATSLFIVLTPMILSKCIKD